MPFKRGTILCTFSALLLLFASHAAGAAAGNNSGTVRGTVTDPSGAVIPGATVHLINLVSGLNQTVQTDATGQFVFTNIPFNPYRISVSADGFAPLSQSLEIRSVVGTSLNLVLNVAGGTQTVTVEASGDLVETDSTFHTDVNREQFIKVPLESASSGLSSLVTLSTPGVAADSNGLFHGLGDHASNSFSVDGQSITDQQSKVFSNQIPSNSIQSIEVISGAPPAEYGGKTSLVIVATTRSGQGVTKPTGSINASYGSFGSSSGGFDLAYGGKVWGNFLEADGLNSGRFLDPPEFQVFHDKGNEQNIFDRADYSFSSADSIHLDLNYSRSWFQTPDSFDNLNVQNVLAIGSNDGSSPTPNFVAVGNTDQHSKIGTFNISPTYTHVISNNAVFNLGAFLRRDDYNYYPSRNPLADLGPANLQTSSITQNRTLTNAAVHSDYSYAKKIHNFKAGAQYGQTFLRENDSLGLVDATYNSPCLDLNGNPLPVFTDPSQCAAAGFDSNSPSVTYPSGYSGTYNSVLAPYDLTRGGTLYNFLGHTDVKELALFVEDQIKAGGWLFNLGLRGDIYNGLTSAQQVQPRLGVAYNIKPTTTVLRVSYARSLETPFNENLVLSSTGCSNAVLSPLLNCSPGISGIMQPGFRNEFHAGLQQAFGKRVVVSGEYIWKYTHNAFDFSVLGNTPITFPIDWHNSKIPGYALRADIPQFHNFSAYLVASSVSARFYPPQVAGAGATVGHTGLPFRIDHDEKFNQTTHIQYTLSRGKRLNGLWGSFNWRYDSGLVAGSTPCYGIADPNTPCGNSSTTLNGQPAIAMVDTNIPTTINVVTGASVALPLTADEEFQAGFACNGDKATPTHALPLVCPASQFTSSLIRIPAPGTGDNDHNPQRIAPRDLFDASIGKDNLFHASRFKTNFDLTAINVTNKYALYNFLSTFSGTHYVTPRALTAKITLNF
ncbi:MAG: carboxypeptidase regulatory-like domain-containing protein [Terracidiphilus sp.]